MMSFWKLGSCWGGGGATVTPAAETAHTSSPRKLTEESNRAVRLHGRPKNSTTMHWKPKLHVISEDIQQRKVESEKKPYVKGKYSKPKGKYSTKTYHDYDYRKASYPIMPMAAFSPAPFVF